MKVRRGLLGLLAVTATAAIGCSSSITGTPQPGLAPVDVGSLNTGSYAKEPTAYEPRVSGPGDVKAIEARRMLNYLVLPTDIDSALTVIGDVELFSYPEDPFVTKILPEKYQPVTIDNKLIAGAYVSRINPDLRQRKKLIVSILRFPTEQDSRKAADDFDRITNADSVRHPIAVEGHPDARATSADDVTAVSFLAKGPFVILTNVGVPQPDQAALAGVFKKTIDKQIELLGQLRLTPLDDILDAPLDPEGIMRRALPKATDGTDPFFVEYDFGALEPAGELHYERNVVEMQAAFRENGVDLVGRRGGITYRARDLPAAIRLQSALVRLGRNDEELAPPPGLPDARCVKLDTTDTIRDYDLFCAVVYGRYVAIVVSKARLSGAIDPALYQRAAAQYAILAKSE
ncbi:hypothetical protein ABZV58_11585 [Nocardia sp. NPDC004654]|uniref:DUF7373 family lipoprotein n=1 Tax=Nocardia sp. NPDC004654 TaxID=3154776 RepID=UPI0033B032EF